MRSPPWNSLADVSGVPTLLGDVLGRGVPWWILLILLPILIFATVLLYRGDRRRVSSGKGWLLTASRVTIISLLALLLIDLALRTKTTVEQEGRVLVVVDESASMSLLDEYRDDEQKAAEAEALSLETTDGHRRIDLVRQALSSPWLEELAKTHPLSLIGLGGAGDDARSLGEVDVGGGAVASHVTEAVEGLSASGTTTDLGWPLVDEVRRLPRDSLAAILLFTDGNDHAGEDVRGDTRAAARELGSLGVPLIAVGVGAQRHPRDGAVLALEAPARVFAGDEVEAEVTVRTVDLGLLTLPLAVTENGRKIAEYTIEIPPGDQIRRWPISWTAGEPGRKKFTISLPGQRGEATEANNRRDAWIDVLSGEARVLYIDGGPRWEYRFLENTWSRDESIRLDAFLVTRPPDRRVPEDFPRRREQLFDYDVLVLGDVEADLFTPEEQELFVNFVEARGSTLVLISGEKAMPYSWTGSPLEDILPVELLSPVPSRDRGVQLARQNLELTLTAEGEKFPALRLVAGRQRNVELWSLLPTFNWVNPVKDVSEGSTPLAVLGPPGDRSPPGSGALPPRGREGPGSSARAGVPVLASRPSGVGKVFYSGTDSTWRWRFRFGDLFYRRFWGQVVRWAVSERLSVSDRYVRLGTDRLIYESGEPAEIRALIERSPGEPLRDSWIDAVVRPRVAGPAGSTGTARPGHRVPLERIPRSGGRYRGTLTGEALRDLTRDLTGDLPEFEVQLEIAELDDYATLEDRATATFVVRSPPRLESLDLACDRRFLEDLASLSGGAYLPLADLRKAAELLPVRPSVEEVTRVTAIIDYPLLIALVVLGLVGMEWTLRKRWGLM